MTKGFFASPVAFSSEDDTWATPREFFNKLDKEFNFTLDAAALRSSALCANWYGPDHPETDRRDAFSRDWANERGGGGDLAQSSLRKNDWRMDGQSR